MALAKEQTLMDEFSIFIKAKMSALGLTQRELAIKVYGNEKRESFISDIVNGKRSVTLETASIILTALDSKIKFLE